MTLCPFTFGYFTQGKHPWKYPQPPAPTTAGSRNTFRDGWLSLNNENFAGVVKHRLWGCSDVEEPGQTRECRKDPAFFPAAGSFATTAREAEALASLLHQNSQINSQKHFEGKQINMFLPLKIDNIIRKQQMCFRAQHTVQGRWAPWATFLSRKAIVN